MKGADEAKAEQIDRDAAAAHYHKFAASKIVAGEVDDNPLVQAFARHRLAERDAIVAWLRTFAEPKVDPVDHRAFVVLADAIEQGAHLQEESRG